MTELRGVYRDPVSQAFQGLVGEHYSVTVERILQNRHGEVINFSTSARAQLWQQAYRKWRTALRAHGTLPHSYGQIEVRVRETQVEVKYKNTRPQISVVSSRKMLREIIWQTGQDAGQGFKQTGGEYEVPWNPATVQGKE